MLSPQKKARFLRRMQKRTARGVIQSVLQKAATSAFQQAASRHMQVMGYNVIAEDGWVIKRYADGRTEKISPIKPVNRNRNIVLR